ncbi:MAG: helix-turn-helix domain-containing protein [Dysgonomonas sp.]|uniref:helix-turn-helix domain-containing protein n=1 Tax=Dysgonomonas sp. TaxID=1891233 RepID=UPI003A87BFDB
MIHEFSILVNISVDDLLGRSRKKEIALHRAVYWWLLHRVGFSYAAIGRLNERKHCSIRIAVIKIDFQVMHHVSDTMEIVDKVKHLIDEYKKVKL